MAGGPGAEARPEGLIASLRGLVAGLAALARSRLQILASDLEEAGLRVGAIVVYALVALYLVFIGTVLAVLFVVVLFWQSSPLLVIGLLCALFFGGAFACALLALSTARAAPRLFETTVTELQKDVERFRRRE